MKRTFGRDFYIPRNSVEHQSEFGAVYYTYQIAEKVAAAGFAGKRSKPDWHHTFRNQEQMQAHVAAWLDGIGKTAAMKSEWKAKRDADKCFTPLDVWNKARAKGGYIDDKDAAICLRAVLAANFPGVKFSVRTDRSLSVHWTDGPTAKEVDAIAHNYAFEGFDGMIDMRYSIKRWLSRDGTMSLAHSTGTEGSMGSDPEVVGDPHRGDAVLVTSGPDFVFTHREISEPVKRRLAETVCRKFGIPMPDQIDNLERFLNTTTDGNGEYLCALVHRESCGAND